MKKLILIIMLAVSTSSTAAALQDFGKLHTNDLLIEVGSGDLAADRMSN